MTNASLADAILGGVEALHQSLPAEAAAQLADLLLELSRWNRRINLTAIREPERMVAAHVLDSLSIRPQLNGDRVLDLGTGAGFPGLPLAIAEPERHFVLLDSSAKKIGFVRHMIARLGLDNALAEQTRAEDYSPEAPFATVVARAVTSTAGLLGIGARHVREGGVLLAMKGRHPADELEALPDDWTSTVSELHVPGLEGHARHLVRLSRKSSA